jgi:hypothetical protein
VDECSPKLLLYFSKTCPKKTIAQWAKIPPNLVTLTRNRIWLRQEEDAQGQALTQPKKTLPFKIVGSRRWKRKGRSRRRIPPEDQGCQMVYFKTKTPNLGGVLQWKMWVYLFYGHLVYFMTIWYILGQFGIVYGIGIYFPRFGMLHQNNLATLPRTASFNTLSNFCATLAKQLFFYADQ